MRLKMVWVGILLFIIFSILLSGYLVKAQREPFSADNVTVVSGYWKVKNKHGNDKYDEWFKNTFRINQKYVFFCDKSMNEYISKLRNGYETVFVDYPLERFYSKSFAKDDWVHPINVPSKEIGMIWNEKVHLIKLAKDMDKNPTEYYMWIDAGIAPYREKMPPQKRLNIDSTRLPSKKLYYSGVDEDYHHFSAGVLILHRDIIDEFHDKYYSTLQSCNEEWKCGSEQVIFTKMQNVYPELFHE